MSETDIGIPAMDHAVRMAVELHHLPAGPLDMYTRLDLTRRSFTEPAGIKPSDMVPEYSVLYFPEKNRSFNDYNETISVIRHNPEHADESKTALCKVLAAQLGQWAIDQHNSQRYFYKTLYESAPGSKDTSKCLNIPYAAVIFSSIPKLSRRAEIAQLHIFARTKAERALSNLQKGIKQDNILVYEANADSVERVIC